MFPADSGRETWFSQLFTLIVRQLLTCLNLFKAVLLTLTRLPCFFFKRSFLCLPPLFCPLFIARRTWSCRSRSLLSSKTCWRGCCREMFPRGSAVRAKGIVHAPTSSVSPIINDNVHMDHSHPSGVGCRLSSLGEDSIRGFVL